MDTEFEPEDDCTDTQLCHDNSGSNYRHDYDYYSNFDCKGNNSKICIKNDDLTAHTKYKNNNDCAKIICKTNNPTYTYMYNSDYINNDTSTSSDVNTNINNETNHYNLMVIDKNNKSKTKQKLSPYLLSKNKYVTNHKINKYYNTTNKNNFIDDSDCTGCSENGYDNSCRYCSEECSDSCYYESNVNDCYSSSSRDTDKIGIRGDYNSN
eukprot:Pgem_evm1s5430